MALTASEVKLIERMINRVNPVLDLLDELWRDVDTFNTQNMYNHMNGIQAEIPETYPIATFDKVVATINLYKALLKAANDAATGDAPTHNPEGAISALLNMRL